MADDAEILALLDTKSDDELIAAINAAPTQQERDAIGAFLTARLEHHLDEAIGVFEKASDQFIKLIDQLQGVIGGLPASPAISQSPLIAALAAETSEAYAKYYSRISFGAATDDPGDAPAPAGDETEAPPADNPPPAPPADQAVLDTPQPINSKKYPDLADEYVRFFAGARLRPNVPKVANVPAIVKKNADRAVGNRAHYEAVGGALGIPWWFIAGVHQMESGFNFGTHLHNGDPLTARTKQVPKGRPKADPAAGPGKPYTWEESAIDALTGQGLKGLTDWSLPRALYRWEAYNGFGYRSRHVATPYIWSFTTIYGKGRFTSDGHFDANATSQQCGAGALLRELVDRGLVEV